MVHALGKTGWNVFWDRTIPISKTWREVVGDEIESCRSMIVVWSKTSILSDWVLDEAEEGKKKRRLFPVLIDDVSQPYGFRSIQAANLVDWDGETDLPEYRRLITDLTTLLGEPPAVGDEPKRKEDEEAKRQAEAEDLKKHEAERKRKTEEEAKRKATEEEKCKKEEETGRKAEEARRKAEDEAKLKAKKERQRAEEEKRKAEEERKKAGEAEKGKQETTSGVKVSSRRYVPWLIVGAVIIILAGMFLSSQKNTSRVEEVYTPPTIEMKPVPEVTQRIEKEEPIARKGRLFVQTAPSDARVRILNIAPAYTHGIELDAGEYHIEVSKGDYETQDKWVTLGASRDLEVTIELKPMAIAKQPQKDNTWTEPYTGMEFVQIPGGSSGIEDDFYMGKYEVTQKEWKKVMGDNPSHFKGCDECPVENVSWNQVQEFLKKLNAQTGKGIRLPTDEEWLYACRSGGKNEKWAGTNSERSLGDYAWYWANSGRKTHPVGQKMPNGFDLYDMSGNVYEWISMETLANSLKIRGGSWNNDQDNAYCFDRYPSSRHPEGWHFNVGFRCARTL
jgi:formylglycine-generating enzyme required for sulfatase activity